MGTLLITVLITGLGLPLQTKVGNQPGPPAPWGIVSYELAGSVSQTNEILAAWQQSPGAVAAAWQSLLLDFLYLILYSTTLAYCCYLAATAFPQHNSWYRGGLLLMYGQWLAAIFDGLENIALLIMVQQGQAVYPLPQAAFWLATFKFLLILLGLGYALMGLLLWGSSKLYRNGD